jgi:hypothetical protein
VALDFLGSNHILRHLAPIHIPVSLLSSSASLFFFFERATICCPHRIRPQSANRLHPYTLQTNQCKVPVPATVLVPRSSVRLPFLLTQAQSPATASATASKPFPSGVQPPQPQSTKYRYLAAPTRHHQKKKRTCPAATRCSPTGGSLEPPLTRLPQSSPERAPPRALAR